MLFSPHARKHLALGSSDRFRVRAAYGDPKQLDLTLGFTPGPAFDLKPRLGFLARLLFGLNAKRDFNARQILRFLPCLPHRLSTQADLGVKFPA